MSGSAEHPAGIDRAAVYAANVARQPSSDARQIACAPCARGDHVDHHHGVWRRADGSSPVICSCPRCGEVGQAALFEASC